MSDINEALNSIVNEFGNVSARIRQLEKNWFSSVSFINSIDNPTDGKPGDVVVNEYDNTIKMYNGTNWILLSSSTGELPPPPTNVSAIVVPTGYQISWTPPNATGIKEYVVYSDDNFYGSSKTERARTSSSSVILDFTGDTFFWVGSVSTDDLTSTLVGTGEVLGSVPALSIYFVTAVEFGGYYLNWEKVTNAVDYEVEGAENASGLNNKEVWVGNALYTPVIKELGITHFRIRAVAGDGTTSAWTPWVTDAQNPPQPQHTVISDFEKVTISIDNNDTSHLSEGFAHYRIRRADDEFGSVNVTVIDESAEFAQFPYVIPQSPGTTKWYELTPYDWANNAGTATGWESGTSDIILGWTSHQFRDDGHVVSWYHYNTSQVDYYVIYRNSTPSLSGATIVDGAISNTATSYIIPYTTDYYFGIKAVYLDATETAIYWTQEYDPTVTPPTGVTANMSEVGGWVVEWNDVNNTKKYEVQGNSVAQESGAATRWSGKATTTPTLKYGDDNFWRVRCIGYAGNSAWTSWYTDSNPPPQPIMDLNSIPGHAVILISPSDTSHLSIGFSHYIVEKADDAIGTNSVTLDSSREYGGFPYQVAQDALTTKYYRITPVDIAGNQGTATAWAGIRVLIDDQGFQDKFDTYGGSKEIGVEGVYWLQHWDWDFEGPVYNDTTLAHPFISGKWRAGQGTDVYINVQSVDSLVSGNKAVRIYTSQPTGVGNMTLTYAYDPPLKLDTESRFNSNDDKVMVVVDIDDINELKVGGDGITIEFFHDIYPIITQPYARASVPTSNLSTGINYIQLSKSDFTIFNGFDWTIVDYVSIIVFLEGTGPPLSQVYEGDVTVDDLRIVKADPNDATTFNDTGNVWDFVRRGGGDPIWHVYTGNIEGEPPRPYSLGLINPTTQWDFAFVDGLNVETGIFQVGTYINAPRTGHNGLCFFIQDTDQNSIDGYAVTNQGTKVGLHRIVNNAIQLRVAEADITSVTSELVWIGIDVRDFNTDPGRIRIYVSQEGGGNVITSDNLVISYKDTSPLTPGGTAGFVAYNQECRFVNYTAGSPYHAEVSDVSFALDGPVINSGSDSKIWFRNAGNSAEMSVNGKDFTGIGAINVIRTAGLDTDDHETLQDAINFFSGKVCSGCYIDVSETSLTENLFLDGIVTNSVNGLVIRGDTRGHVGFTYIHGHTAGNERGSNSNLGANGAVSLSNSGNQITVSIVGGNPDFDNLGIVSGDRVRIRNTGGVYADYTVSSTINNTLILSVGAPVVNANGCSLTFIPNRSINAASSSNFIDVYSKVTFQGFELVGFGGTNNLMSCKTDVSMRNCVVKDGYYIETFPNGFFQNTGPITFMHMNGGLRISTGGGARVFQDVFFIDMSNGGIFTEYGGNVTSLWCTASDCVRGFYSYMNSSLRAQYNHTVICTTGYFADYNSAIDAVNTSTRNVGNTTNYSPPTSGTTGNVESVIRWS